MKVRLPSAGSGSTISTRRNSFSSSKSACSTSCEKSTVDYVNTVASRRYAVDVLMLVTRGTRMLKLCRTSSSSPHFRFFHVDIKSMSLKWNSWFKSSSMTTIPLKDVVSIEQGHNTPSFMLQQSSILSELAPVSFTITYKTTEGLRPLSLVVEDAQSMITWFSTLLVLVECAREAELGEPTKRLENLFLKLPILGQNVSYRDLLDRFL